MRNSMGPRAGQHCLPGHAEIRFCVGTLRPPSLQARRLLRRPGQRPSTRFPRSPQATGSLPHLWRAAVITRPPIPHRRLANRRTHLPPPPPRWPLPPPTRWPWRTLRRGWMAWRRTTWWMRQRWTPSCARPSWTPSATRPGPTPRRVLGRRCRQPWGSCALATRLPTLVPVSRRLQVGAWSSHIIEAILKRLASLQVVRHGGHQGGARCSASLLFPPCHKLSSSTQPSHRAEAVQVRVPHQPHAALRSRHARSLLPAQQP